MENANEEVQVRRGADRLGHKQAEDGTAVGEVCCKAGVSANTFYNWRKRDAGLMPSKMKQLRQLEEENGKLKGSVAGLSLDKAMLQDVLQKNL
ncbi:transposase [Pelagibacterium sp.]|uniref:transposase n=1 Tax=Pelagibacterium sp. TaxID=1967288 RepID=UPI003A8FE0A1